jgi:protein-L-isoaspartate(D-aspartate) O-methyltransferase
VIEDEHVLRDRLVDVLVRYGACRTGAAAKAMREVNRHAFVPEVSVADAYANEAIIIKRSNGMPISSISQPSMIVWMLDELAVEPGHTILEIGAGSGYNAALLATMVRAEGRVVSMELDPGLATRARVALASEGHDNATVVVGDGKEGCEEHAPYDGVIVTAGADQLAPAWGEQLREGGHIVVPLARLRRAVAYRKEDGRLVEQATTSAGFLPLR